MLNLLCALGTEQRSWGEHICLQQGLLGILSPLLRAAAQKKDSFQSLTARKRQGKVRPRRPLEGAQLQGHLDLQLSAEKKQHCCQRGPGKGGQRTKSGPRHLSWSLQKAAVGGWREKVCRRVQKVLTQLPPHSQQQRGHRDLQARATARRRGLRRSGGYSKPLCAPGISSSLGATEGQRKTTAV